MEFISGSSRRRVVRGVLFGQVVALAGLALAACDPIQISGPLPTATCIPVAGIGVDGHGHTVA